MFDKLYLTRSDDRAPWGRGWCGPDKFEGGVDTLIARIAKPPESDGQSVEVYCCAFPTRFLHLVVAPDPDRLGNPQPGCEIELGSGMTQLAVDLAKAIACGMLAVTPLTKGKAGQK